MNKNLLKKLIENVHKHSFIPSVDKANNNSSIICKKNSHYQNKGKLVIKGFRVRVMMCMPIVGIVALKW